MNREIIVEELNKSIINASRSESMEQLKFYQGQISAFGFVLGNTNDAFAEDEKCEHGVSIGVKCTQCSVDKKMRKEDE